MLKKVTASQVYEVSNVIKRLANSPLPIKIAYAFSKNIKSITRELEELNAIRQKFIDEYAERDEKGDIVMANAMEVKLKDETRKEFDDKFKEFLNMEVELEVHTVALNQFTVANINLTPTEMAVLDFMFDVEETVN